MAKALRLEPQSLQKYSAEQQSISVCNYTCVNIEALLHRALLLAERNLVNGTQMRLILKRGAA
jgi:hypothetical protein